MQTLTRCVLFTALAVSGAAPLLAHAADEAHCRFSEPRKLDLDLAGAKSVLFKVGSNTLKLKASAGAPGALSGRACAAKQDGLKDLTLTQQRQGDKLVVSLAEDRPLRLSFGDSYTYLDIAGTLPADVLVQLDVGSGDATLEGAGAASADVGSGDADLRDIAGPVTAKVGSGDLKLRGAGSLRLLEVASGDVEGERIGGPVEVGGVGSGDLSLRQTGAVTVKSIGSGDVGLHGVSGNVQVGSIGSGSLVADDVRGDLTVHSRGSGDIDTERVSGTVSVPEDR